MNMIDRPQRRIARALLKGASLIALGIAAPLQAEESPATASAGPSADGMIENRYFMMMMTQTFDGLSERSHSQKAGFARLRKGEESWINIDYGDGAMVIVRPGQLSVGNFVNQTPTEIALAYDYRTHALRGNTATAGYHNRYVRPLLGRSPPLGSDAAWEIQVTPEQMGVPGATGEALTLALKRRYFSHGGRQYVLIDYAAPAFSYKNAAGETIVHWAHGAALADPGFGQIYWNGSLQRAVAQQAGGDPRPYRFARTILAMDLDGKPLVDPADIPELKPYVADFYSKEATAPIPTAATAGEPDQTPLQLAALLDVVALSVAENSANQLGETVGSYVHGETGRNTGAQIDQAVLETGRDIAPYIDTTVEAYSQVPDKFVAALSGIANMRGTISEAEFIARTGLSLSDLQGLSRSADSLARRTNQLQDLATTLRSQLAFVSGRAEQLRNALQSSVAQAYSLDDLMGGTRTTVAYADYVEMQRRAEALTREVSLLDRNLKANVAAGEQIAERLPVLQRLQQVAQERGLLRFAQGFGEALDKYKLTPVFTVLGGLGNISSVYSSARSLGEFDPGAAGDLSLSGEYDSGRAMAGNLALTVLGTAGNLASGNIMAAVADVATLATGSFTDLYMAVEAARATEGQVQYAHMQHMLTLMRKAKLDEQHMRRAQERLDQLGQGIAALGQEIANRPTGNITSDDWRDPRFDSATGLPIPDYWAWLKENDPDTLARMGIDPDAPVGGWPGGRRPGPTRPTEVVQPRQPGGPDYPQGRPREQQADARDTAQEATDRAASGSQPDPAAAEAARAAAEAAETTNRDAGLIAGESAEQAGEAANQIGSETASELAQQAAGATGPRWAAEGTAPLDVSSLNVTPLNFDPVGFKPVEMKPVTSEPVTWEPPEWVPPEFDAPKPMQLPWPDFGDDQYDFGGDPNNLAFDYGDMSGKVATDLAKWKDWLKTQNVRELERMALAAGYPNLASALTDAENLIRKARDSGFRRWANDIPAMSGSIGLWASEAQHNLARAQLALGDLLAPSREIFSSGGLSDIGISGFDLAYLLRDFSLEDGDIIDIELTQFGRNIFTTRLSLLNAGTEFLQTLRPGVARLLITAVNEGFSSPNTAEINIKNVVRGQANQSYSLNTGQTAALRIEADAKLEED